MCRQFVLIPHAKSGATVAQLLRVIRFETRSSFRSSDIRTLSTEHQIIQILQDPLD